MAVSLQSGFNISTDEQSLQLENQSSRTGGIVPGTTYNYFLSYVTHYGATDFLKITAQITATERAIKITFSKPQPNVISTKIYRSTNGTKNLIVTLRPNKKEYIDETAEADVGPEAVPTNPPDSLQIVKGYVKNDRATISSFSEYDEPNEIFVTKEYNYIKKNNGTATVRLPFISNALKGMLINITHSGKLATINVLPYPGQEINSIVDNNNTFIGKLSSVNTFISSMELIAKENGWFIIDYTTNNISIVENKVTKIDVTEYGIENDGITDVTTKIQELFDDANINEINFPFGTYKCSAPLTISRSNLYICGTNATFDFSTLPFGVDSTDRPTCITISGTDDFTESINISLLKNGFTVILNKGTGFDEFDYVLLSSDDEYRSTGITSGSVHQIIDHFESGRLMRIRTFISISPPTHFDYMTNFTMQKINMIRNITIENINIIAGGIGSWHNCIRINNCFSSIFREINLDGGEDTGINTSNCFNITIDNCTIKNSRSPSANGETYESGHGIELGPNTRNCTVKNTNFEYCRQSITGGLNKPSIFNTISNCTSYSCGYLINDFTINESCMNWTYDTCITGVNTVEDWHGGFHIGGDDAHLINCTTITARNNAVLITQGVINTQITGLKCVNGQGIEIDGTSTAIVANCIIDKCKFVSIVVAIRADFCDELMISDCTIIDATGANAIIINDSANSSLSKSIITGSLGNAINFNRCNLIRIDSIKIKTVFSTSLQVTDTEDLIISNSQLNSGSNNIKCIELNNVDTIIIIGNILYNNGAKSGAGVLVVGVLDLTICNNHIRNFNSIADISGTPLGYIMVHKNNGRKSGALIIGAITEGPAVINANNLV